MDEIFARIGIDQGILVLLLMVLVLILIVLVLMILLNKVMQKQNER